MVWEVDIVFDDKIISSPREKNLSAQIFLWLKYRTLNTIVEYSQKCRLHLFPNSVKKKVQCVDILSGIRIYGLHIFNTYIYMYTHVWICMCMIILQVAHTYPCTSKHELLYFLPPVFNLAHSFTMYIPLKRVQIYLILFFNISMEILFSSTFSKTWCLIK